MANPARATTTDLSNLGPAQSRISQVSTSQKQAALNAASDYLDGLLESQFTLPLLAPYPQDVIYFEVIYASMILIRNVGYSPMSPIDQALDAEYQRMLTWATQVSKGEITPSATDSSSDGAEGGPFSITSTSRGYSERGIDKSFPRITTDSFTDD